MITQGGGGITRFQALPRKHLDGLNFRNNPTNPYYQADIDAGEAISDDDTELIETTGETVDITASGANGLDTGSEANKTWYYIFLIKNPTSGAVAGLLSASNTAPTMPSGYTKKRLVGAIKNDWSGNFIPVQSYGAGRNKFVSYDRYKEILHDGNSATWADLDCSAYCPAGAVFAHLIALSYNDINPGFNYIRPKGFIETSEPTIFGQGGAAGGENWGGSQDKIKLDSNRLVEYKIAIANSAATTHVIGYDIEL